MPKKNETSRSRRQPRLHTNRANLERRHRMSCHIIILRRIRVCKACDSFCKLAFVAKWPRRHDTPWHCARAPTSVVRGRAQKNVRSRAQGDVASSEKSQKKRGSFAQKVKKPAQVRLALAFLLRSGEETAVRAANNAGLQASGVSRAARTPYA